MTAEVLVERGTTLIRRLRLAPCEAMPCEEVTVFFIGRPDAAPQPQD